MTAKEQAEAENDGSRFVARPGEVTVFREEDMVCVSCRRRLGKASECDGYQLKPAGVMRGERVCPDLEEER